MNEPREILVANTKTQRRYKITTIATTLGELKADLDANNIDYAGLEFTEGITKTKLLDDTTPLPQEVMYKGQPTRNLAILLTNTKSKIDSGIEGTRGEAYDIIRENEWQDAVKEEFGRNFTLVSSNDLWDFINRNVEPEESEADDNSSCVCETLEVLRNAATGVVGSIYDMVHTMVEDEYMTEDELAQLSALLCAEQDYWDENEPNENEVETSDGRITNDDVTDMIDSIQ